MENVKYLILGAGPAGLTFASRLKQLGEDSFAVLEKENEAGGLCRSVMVDGSPFDIGGGHFLDTRRPLVNEFLFRFMPREEWELFERDSRILIENLEIGHPLEANIWQLAGEQQEEILASIAAAGCNNGREMPVRFKEWIVWKLGEKIAEMYMLPYNRKMFCDELDELGTYWLEKLPSVSYEETLRSCRVRKAYGKQPGHATFYYPKKYGYGEVWLRMAAELGEHIRYQANVQELDVDRRCVRTADGSYIKAEKIISTIPWGSFSQIRGMDEELHGLIASLKHSAVETRYVKENLDTEAQWLYIPDEDKPYHRILVRHNFCTGSRGYWLETRKERVPMYTEPTDFAYMNEYAYPMNTIGKVEAMQKILAFCRAKGIYGLGRWGEHSHYNSDVVVEAAMKFAEMWREKSH